MAFEAANGLAPGLTLGPPPLHISPASDIEPSLYQRDGMDGAVEAPVATPVETVPLDLAGGSGDWSSSGRRSEVALRGKAMDIPNLGQDPPRD
jgi:hypothetical protein